MHIHILGVSGTFMSALALLARALGHHVTGSDAACYPPISDLLQQNNIQWQEGYDDATLALKADCVIVGNAIKRGMPVIEAVLAARKPYISGPQWLAEQVLPRYKVMAVSGTHGKTTTTSMLALILHHAGLQPGFLIGGVSSNFQTSACLGAGSWFVIEADEYDSAFFDKRPKLMHYRPQVAILNNLEYDHADIYSDLAAIQQQFHYFLRTIPNNGLVIKPRDDVALNQVIERGLYSVCEDIALKNNDERPAVWQAALLDDQGSAFQVWHKGEAVAQVEWNVIGRFNVENALAAIAASAYAGVKPAVAAEALAHFTPVKRRLEVKAQLYGITIYDDFAHHPTAITKTIQALKHSGRHQRILVVLEFASYTMRTGVHAEAMRHALSGVDGAFILNPDQFNLKHVTEHWSFPYMILKNIDEIVEQVTSQVKFGDAILVMSNRGFGGIHHQLNEKIESRRASLNVL